MIEILADTSALVSLEIKHLINLASKHIHFSISEGIREELQDIAEFDDVHGRSARDVLKLVQSRIITVQSMPAREEHTYNLILTAISEFIRVYLRFETRTNP